MRQHGSAPLSLSVRIPRPSLQQAFKTLLLIAALPLNTSVAFAQGAGGGATTPATAVEIERMVSVASINMCILSKSKVPFVTAMQANMVPMVSYIKEVNGSKIVGVKNGQALTPEEIANHIPQVTDNDLLPLNFRNGEKILPLMAAKQIKINS